MVQFTVFAIGFRFLSINTQNIRNKVIRMSSEIVFEDRSDLNVLTMDMFDLADCCRACLRIECSLTATNSSDNDSIKLCDKLAACVSEIMWLKEGAPSLICTACIEKLRIAYDFRNACLQSEHTLQRYANQIQVEAKQQNSINNRPLVTPTKFEFTISNVAQEGLPCIIEEPQNQEYLHLKHFLDTNGELLKSEQIVETTQTSRSSTPDQRNTTTFISDHHVQTIDTIESQIETPQLQEAYTETDSVESQEVSLQLTNQTEHLHNQNKVEVLQQPQPQQKQEVQLAIHHLNSRVVITKTTGVQVRPPSPPRDSHEAGGKPFRCTVCGKHYRKNANLRIHMRTHTGEKPFECKYCEKRFYHSSHLREHIRRHTGEKPFQCTICNKRFTIKGELTMHTKSHTGERPYACTCCDRRCLTAADLKVHMRTHTGEKPYTCETCGKKFASTYILNSHIKTHTGERPYTCKVCDKTFTQSSHLNVHMRKHTGEKFSCKVCYAKFTHASQLTVHMREHTGKQPYKCSVCFKICNYASELQTHMIKHNGVKFTCVTCDKKFTTSSYLQEHIRTHTGENLSTCTMCDRQFTRQQYLEKHMRTHTGEKPYSCLTCGKKFTQSSSLKVHMRIHTGEKPYSCTICDRRFTTSSDLSQHNKKHKKYISL